MRALIVTADDFGLALPVNEAVERAHRYGILTSTSLLVGAAAADDAIERARRNPGLRVGLHIALCEGQPISDPDSIPDLVADNGEFHAPLAAATRLCRPGIGAQIERELRAQFAAFRASGLRLDHVDAHNNLQLHPRVLPRLLRIAREYGAPGIRLPYEPLLPALRAAPRGALRKLALWSLLLPWSRHVKRRIRGAGFVVNDYLLGMYDCGQLDRRLMTRLIGGLPAGISELHCHPASGRCSELDRTMPDYQHARELEALLSDEVRRAMRVAGIHALRGFYDLRRETRSQGDEMHEPAVESSARQGRLQRS